MKGGIIYTPRGLAAEYGKLGANLYNPGLEAGCRAGCKYCNNPHMPVVRLRREIIEAAEYKPKVNVLDRLCYDCTVRFRECKTPVVMGFVGDIYQPHAEGDDVTRDALTIMRDFCLVPAVLTKFGTRAVRDFDLLKETRGWFGQTLAWMLDQNREKWEPHASDVEDRCIAWHRAKEAGIRTWVSVEPVIHSQESLASILNELTHGTIDHFKLGKLSGYDAATREIERSIDWPAYRERARHILTEAGYTEITEPGAFEVGTFYVKRELATA